MKTYRVWVEQVNQVSVDIKAKDAADARQKGYVKWRKEEAHSRVSWVEEVKP